MAVAMVPCLGIEPPSAKQLDGNPARRGTVPDMG